MVVVASACQASPDPGSRFLLLPVATDYYPVLLLLLLRDTHYSSAHAPATLLSPAANSNTSTPAAALRGQPLLLHELLSSTVCLLHPPWAPSTTATAPQ